MEIGPRTDVWEHETEAMSVIQFRREINGKIFMFTSVRKQDSRFTRVGLIEYPVFGFRHDLTMLAEPRWTYEQIRDAKALVRQYNSFIEMKWDEMKWDLTMKYGLEDDEVDQLIDSPQVGR